MPRVLAAHETFLQRPLLQVADEVPVPATPLLGTTTSPSSSSWRAVHTSHPVLRRRIVRWTGLESDGLGRIQMARHPLNGSGDTALLLFHRRRPCPLSSSPLLRVQARIGHVPIRRRGHLLLRLTHRHLAVGVRLRSIRRRLGRVTAARRVHRTVVAVHRWWLVVAGLVRSG